MKQSKLKSRKLTKKENADRIAAAGTAAAKLKFEESRDLIQQEMRKIDAEIEKNDGVYPYAGGKVSAAEVLRRLGKGEAYLRKKEPPVLVELRQEVESWVDYVTREMAAGARIVRRKVTERVEQVKTELDLVRQHYHEAEIELSDTQTKLQQAEKKLEEMQKQNTMLLKRLNDKMVVDLDSRRK